MSRPEQRSGPAMNERVTPTIPPSTDRKPVTDLRTWLDILAASNRLAVAKPGVTLHFELAAIGFEFTAQLHRIAYFAAFLNRIGTMKAKLADWKDLFWETAHNQVGD
jgi:hypothetical protein